MAQYNQPTNYTSPLGGSSIEDNFNAYGSIPQLPQAATTAPGAVAGSIQQGNLVNAQLPGYNADLSSIGGNIQSETAGVIPDDVKRQLTQHAAERGIATGTAGSPNNDAALLRALGLTSLDLTKMGTQQWQSVLQSLPGARISQDASFYPSSAGATDVNSSNAIYRSAPDPRAASRAAIGATNAGIATGRGSVPQYQGGGVPQTDFWNTGPSYSPSQVVRGSDVNTTGALNTGAMSQSDVDQILQRYNPVGDFGSSVAEEGGPGYQGVNLWETGGGGTTTFDYGNSAPDESTSQQGYYE